MLNIPDICTQKSREKKSYLKNALKYGHKVIVLHYLSLRNEILEETFPAFGGKKKKKKNLPRAKNSQGV